jgi:membrane-bound lytic murein transglycosylase F
LGRLAGLIFLVLLLPTGLRAQSVTSRFDPAFRKYSKRFFGVGFDWRLFKAQGMTESNLNPRARSWVGARGVMQLMPSTFQEIQSRNPSLVSLDDPEWNIAAGIQYDRRLWLLWAEDSVYPHDHHDFMLASYNAGRIPLLRAQAVARRQYLDHRDWHSIVSVAPAVPRWRHRETLDYVMRIEGNLSRMDENGRVVRPFVSTDTVLVEAARP